MTQITNDFRNHWKLQIRSLLKIIADFKRETLYEIIDFALTTCLALSCTTVWTRDVVWSGCTGKSQDFRPHEQERGEDVNIRKATLEQRIRLATQIKQWARRKTGLGDGAFASGQCNREGGRGKKVFLDKVEEAPPHPNYSARRGLQTHTQNLSLSEERRRTPAGNHPFLPKCFPLRSPQFATRKIRICSAANPNAQNLILPNADWRRCIFENKSPHTNCETSTQKTKTKRTSTSAKDCVWSLTSRPDKSRVEMRANEISDNLEKTKRLLVSHSEYQKWKIETCKNIFLQQAQKTKIVRFKR